MAIYVAISYREVFDVPLSSLPAYEIREDKTNYCDVCTDKKLGNQPAVRYCTTCDRTYCGKHQEVLLNVSLH